jgi:hypothetical protein
MRPERLVAPLLFVLVTAAGFAACARPPATCAFCEMEIPAETRTTAIVDGKPQLVCDPRCALTHQGQTGQPVSLARVTDLPSGVALDPRQAFYVMGSDTAPDARGAERAAMRMWPAAQASLQWHRCLPSVLAFRDRDTALRHVRDHGGRIASYTELGFTASSH